MLEVDIRKRLEGKLSRALQIIEDIVSRLEKATGSGSGKSIRNLKEELNYPRSRASTSLIKESSRDTS